MDLLYLSSVVSIYYVGSIVQYVGIKSILIYIEFARYSYVHIHVLSD